MLSAGCFSCGLVWVSTIICYHAVCVLIGSLDTTMLWGQFAKGNEVLFSAGSPIDTLSLVKVRRYGELDFYTCAVLRNGHHLGFNGLFALVALPSGDAHDEHLIL